ncbi:tripartite tricarboxylate transporter substrate binding protein [Alphaproteobacteria bacterium KMM 3653]|uniref:Tripartite tricarboxylate transporter substrate binding protein n=1 Tax=Harenicola maris TaxID=2841044 RepID=A0AAP2CST3_9RHOB|nr:tripartite tricarboxylate transporter substrate binding protein [Harenicola maris]
MTSTKLTYGMVGALGALMGLAGPVMAQDWVPSEPVTIIVPWSAGGSTDSVTRVLAGELESALGQSVVVVNQPGAAGSVGTNSAWTAERDGLTWAAGAAVDLGTYPVLGMVDAQLSDWAVYLHIANVAVVGVNPGSGIETFDQLIDKMKAEPGSVSVATAGVTSGGHNAMEAIAGALGVEYKHVTYDGGQPAVLATVSGETMVTTQLASEQAEMIRGTRIRPLAVLASAPLELEGYGEIPPITNWAPDLKPANNYFGIWAPADTPAEVLATMDKIWTETISNSAALKEYAAGRGAFFDPSTGDAAQAAAAPMISQNAWMLYDAKKAENSPEAFGIPRP